MLSKKLYFKQLTRQFSQQIISKTKSSQNDLNISQYTDADYEIVKKSRIISSEKPFYDKPLLIHEGHGQWLWDHEGQKYLDMFSGVATVSVGHSHPKIVSAVTKQISKLGHTTAIYMHSKYHDYVEKLKSKLPDKFDTIYLVNSGSEANELAFLIARLFTETQEIISLQNSYHGGTFATQSATGMSIAKYSMPQLPGFIQVMNPNVFEGPWGGSQCRNSSITINNSSRTSTHRTCQCIANECLASEKYFNQLENTFKYNLSNSGKVAGFIAESIQGIGGVVQYPRGYLNKVYDLIKSKGGLCIADEVQTGFARTGDYFWGFEDHQVEPDIITMAKGIGNGFPLGAVATTSKIAYVLNRAMRFNTFGGNPIACTIGSTVLDIIEEERLQENSKTVGTYMLTCLNELMMEYPNLIGDVRGKGLMIGVELISDGKTLKPMPLVQVLNIFEDIKNMGILVGKGGIFANVLRIKPPLCINRENVDFTINVLKKAFDNHTSKNL